MMKCLGIVPVVPHRVSPAAPPPHPPGRASSLTEECTCTAGGIKQLQMIVARVTGRGELMFHVVSSPPPPRLAAPRRAERTARRLRFRRSFLQNKRGWGGISTVSTIAIRRCFPVGVA